MRAIEELNLSNVKTPPTANEIRKLENNLGFRLPAPYVEFLQEANGGYPEVDTFESKDGEQWAINNFFFVGPEMNSPDSLHSNYLNRWTGIPPIFLPIGRDGFGNIFLLNLETGNEGEVWIWIHDDPDNPLVKLSDRFEEFVDQLIINPQYI